MSNPTITLTEYQRLTALKVGNTDRAIFPPLNDRLPVESLGLCAAMAEITSGHVMVKSLGKQHLINAFNFMLWHVTEIAHAIKFDTSNFTEQMKALSEKADELDATVCLRMLAVESGQIASTVKDYAYSSQPLDFQLIERNLLAIVQHINIVANFHGISMQENMQAGIEKASKA